MLPFVPLAEGIFSEAAVSWAWWGLVATLAVVALVGYRWSMRAVPESFRRYEKA
jgi:hypothetical protein